jgi:hypothetical protein
VRHPGLLTFVSVLRRTLRFRSALHRNIRIRKAPVQIGLTESLADLRIILQECCRPDFDEVDIALGPLGAAENFRLGKQRCAMTLSLDLVSRDNCSLGQVRMHRFLDNHSPFLIDLQLLALILQPTLSLKVGCLLASSGHIPAIVNCPGGVPRQKFKESREPVFLLEAVSSTSSHSALGAS